MEIGPFLKDQTTRRYGLGTAEASKLAAFRRWGLSGSGESAMIPDRALAKFFVMPLYIAGNTLSLLLKLDGTGSCLPKPYMQVYPIETFCHGQYFPARRKVRIILKLSQAYPRLAGKLYRIFQPE